MDKHEFAPDCSSSKTKQRLLTLDFRQEPAPECTSGNARLAVAVSGSIDDRAAVLNPRHKLALEHIPVGRHSGSRFGRHRWQRAPAVLHPPTFRTLGESARTWSAWLNLPLADPQAGTCMPPLKRCLLVLLTHRLMLKHIPPPKRHILMLYMHTRMMHMHIAMPSNTNVCCICTYLC